MLDCRNSSAYGCVGVVLAEGPTAANRVSSLPPEKLELHHPLLPPARQSLTPPGRNRTESYNGPNLGSPRLQCAESGMLGKILIIRMCRELGPGLRVSAY